MKRYQITLYKVYPNVRLYTVHFDEKSENETDNFISRFTGNSEFRNDYNKIIYWIDKIGRTGALLRHFRKEDRAEAIPVETSKLRFYCCRLNDNILVLGNGGIKTSKKVKDSPDCLPHFKLMNYVAKKIYWAIEDKQLTISESNELIGKLNFNFPDNE